MRPLRAVVRTELRLVRHDPVPVVVLIVMPVVLVTLLSPALRIALTAEGYASTSGAEQTVPGMISVFSFFAVAIFGFSLFREHGWSTWARLRSSGLGAWEVVGGKLVVPAALLVAQHALLFAFGVALLDLRVTGSWAAVAAVSLAFDASVLALALAVAAVLDTVQQVNAATNLGAMVVGGLGGGFVPVEALPAWIQPLAPLSPAYWAMDGYQTVVLDGGGVGAVALPLAVLAGWAVALAALAGARLRPDRAKRGWG